MKTYRIKDWSDNYENNRTRTMVQMQWIPVCNRHDGDGYTTLVDRKNGAAFLGAWLAILQVASKCNPRGTLVRGGGIPHDSVSISRITRLPSDIIEAALSVLVSDCKWLEIIGQHEGDRHPAVSPHEGDTLLSGIAHPTDYRMEGNGIEGNGKNGTITSGKPDVSQLAKIVLGFLNQRAGRTFREIDANLKPIAARLIEVSLDVDGTKATIERLCKRWKGDPKMDEFLRPETIFSKSKFHSYYDTRDLPVEAKKSFESREVQEIIEVRNLI